MNANGRESKNPFSFYDIIRVYSRSFAVKKGFKISYGKCVSKVLLYYIVDLSCFLETGT